MPIPAQNIHEVISELDIIIQKSISENSKFGLFAALYKKVTENVRDGITHNRFQDNNRMERLDVVFANRYLVAYKQFNENSLITNAWKVAFEASKRNDVLVLQHLLAGMNAHISLDLGIATAEVGLGKPIKDLEQDFNQINILLSELIDKVQDALSESSVLIPLIDKWAGNYDESLARFNLQLFRTRAWQIAVALHSLNEDNRKKYITDLDNQVKKENNFFTKTSGYILSPIIILVAKLQNRMVYKIVQTLNNL